MTFAFVRAAARKLAAIVFLSASISGTAALGATLSVEPGSPGVPAGSDNVVVVEFCGPIAVS